MSKIEFTIDDMIIILKETVDDARAGKISPAVGNTVIKGTNAIFSGARLQMDYARLAGTLPDVKLIGSQKKES